MEVFNHSLWLLISYQNLGFFFYGIYLYVKERNLARLFFALVMLSFGLNVFLLHLHLFEHDRNLNLLFPLLLTTGFTIIPLYYLHLKSQLQLYYKLETSEILHFVPFMVSALALTPFWFLISSNRPEYLDLIYGIFLLKKWPGHQTFLIETGIISALAIQMLYYIWRTKELFSKARIFYLQTDCSNTRHFLDGSKIFAASFFMLIILMVLRNYIQMSERSLSSTLYVLALITLNIGHAYFGIKFSDESLISCLNTHNSTEELKDASDKANIEDKPKYTSSCMCDELKIALIERLERYFDQHVPYLNPKLKIEDIAHELQTNNKYLSQIINEHYGKNFANFINDYRCRKVIEMFENADYHEYSLDGIADSAGFHSRSTFVAAFKKYTGKLPSVYRNELKS